MRDTSIGRAEQTRPRFGGATVAVIIAVIFVVAIAYIYVAGAGSGGTSSPYATNVPASAAPATNAPGAPRYP